MIPVSVLVSWFSPELLIRNYHNLCNLFPQRKDHQSRHTGRRQAIHRYRLL
jgi:hypothetical protein